MVTDCLLIGLTTEKYWFQMANRQVLWAEKPSVNVDAHFCLCHLPSWKNIWSRLTVNIGNGLHSNHHLLSSQTSKHQIFSSSVPNNGYWEDQMTSWFLHLTPDVYVNTHVANIDQWPTTVVETCHKMTDVVWLSLSFNIHFNKQLKHCIWMEG